MTHAWDNFFLLTGGAGATLIGLLFVIVTFVTEQSSARLMAGVRAFLTPTLMNFSGLLFQAVILLTPWPAAWMAGPVLALGGLAGLGYRLRLLRVRRRLEFITLSGWARVLYDAIPLLANLSLLGGGAALAAGQPFAPFAVAGASALMLVAGVAGAWDLTLWTIENRAGSRRR